jgi:uncharacterized protein YigE (DUF2233 family)
VKTFVIFSLCIFLSCGSSVPTAPSPSETKWKQIDQGLELADFNSPVKSVAGDSRITILRIDPQQYDFCLISAKELHEKPKTARNWVRSKKLIAAINAGMYRTDHLTNTAFMQNYDFVNNPVMTADNTVFACNPIDSTVPRAQIIDRECQDWEKLKQRYHTFSQGIRMVDCQQRNKWQKQEKIWSMVVIAKDIKGNMLFIISRSPYSVHEFIEILKDLPIGLYNAMYLEGGPEASFYLDHKGVKVEKFGSYETGFMENDDNDDFWEIPNMIGIKKRDLPTK